MSQQMSARVLAHSQAKGPAFALLLVLAHYEYGRGWVATQDALAAKARVSRPTVQRALIDLQVGGELEVTPRGQKRPNHHRVILDCPLECPDHLKHCYVSMHQTDASETIGCIRVEHSMHQSDARSSSDSSSSLKKKRGAGRQKSPSPSKEPVTRPQDEPGANPSWAAALNDIGDSTDDRSRYWTHRLLTCQPTELEMESVASEYWEMCERVARNTNPIDRDGPDAF